MVSSSVCYILFVCKWYDFHFEGKIRNQITVDLKCQIGDSAVKINLQFFCVFFYQKTALN